MAETRMVARGDGDKDVIIATRKEVVGWYVYDFANSPYYQVYVSALMPIVLKWLAEGYSGGIESDKSHTIPTMNTSDVIVEIVKNITNAALELDPFTNITNITNIVENITISSTDITSSVHEKLTMPGLGITAGSYPALVSLVTILFQTVCLLTFSSFGDYGAYRKQLLMIFTFVGSGTIFLNIFCFSSQMWWFAGILRIIAGICFVMCGVYYNSYLPVLADVHEDNVNTEGKEHADTTIRLSDEMSNSGQLIGYVGGLSVLILSFIILKLYECDSSKETCTEFSMLFLPNLCISIVGLWWAGFSLYTFRVLKSRPGPTFPKGSKLCLGWKDTCHTLREVTGYRHTSMYLASFFIYSDAINTTTSVAVLLLEDVGNATLSSVCFTCIMSATMAILGGFGFMKVQQKCKIKAKNILLFQLFVYSCCCVAGLCGAVTASPHSFILMMAPMMFMIGSIQAYSRSIFAALTPLGSEASMFAFYEITDKGSNLIGALVTFIIHNACGSYLPVFWYLVAAYAISACILFFVDVEQGMKDASKHENSSGSDSEMSSY